jgi:hypothetical protein
MSNTDQILSAMSHAALQKERRRILAKSILSPQDEKRLASLTQQLQKISGVVPFADLSPEEQLREARRILGETR